MLICLSIFLSLCAVWWARARVCVDIDSAHCHLFIVFNRSISIKTQSFIKVFDSFWYWWWKFTFESHSSILHELRPRCDPFYFNHITHTHTHRFHLIAFNVSIFLAPPSIVLRFYSAPSSSSTAYLRLCLTCKIIEIELICVDADVCIHCHSSHPIKLLVRFYVLAAHIADCLRTLDTMHNTSIERFLLHLHRHQSLQLFLSVVLDRFETSSVLYSNIYFCSSFPWRWWWWCALLCFATYIGVAAALRISDDDTMWHHLFPLNFASARLYPATQRAYASFYRKTKSFMNESIRLKLQSRNSIRNGFSSRSNTFSGHFSSSSIRNQRQQN